MDIVFLELVNGNVSPFVDKGLVVQGSARRLFGQCQVSHGQDDGQVRTGTGGDPLVALGCGVG